MEKYIDEWMNGIGSKTAAVLVMNPNNGEILAMASNRRYDLNDPRNLGAMYTQEQIDAMTEEQKSEAWNQMWRNFCVSDSFEPGSPAKPLTVAAALEEGVIGPQETFVCDGAQEVGGHRIQVRQHLRPRRPFGGADPDEILQRRDDGRSQPVWVWNGLPDTRRSSALARRRGSIFPARPIRPD